jgi:hypothetical protein
VAIGLSETLVQQAFPLFGRNAVADYPIIFSGFRIEQKVFPPGKFSHVTRDAMSGILPSLRETWATSMDGPERQGWVERATGSHLQKTRSKKTDALRSCELFSIVLNIARFERQGTL